MRNGKSSGLLIGVLALQGDVAEHLTVLRRTGVKTAAVKTPAMLAAVDGLIVPGGESTTVGAMLERFGLVAPLKERAASGMPVWGTCMGMIVMAKRVAGSSQPTLALLDVEVVRNAFGRQLESAEVPLAIEGIGGKPYPGVFIRAPWIESAWGDARVLSSLDGKGVMVRQDNLLGTSFHPELTSDLRVHEYFLEIVKAARD